MFSKEEYIKNFTGQILGIIKTATNGDQIAYSFPSRKILGYYRAEQNVTTDFVGRILSKNNTVVSLIYNNKDN